MAWADVKAIHGTDRVVLGPSASYQWTHDPAHLAMALARYRAAAALIGDARRVFEFGCGEGIGAGILATGRTAYVGVDVDRDAIRVARSIHGRREDMTFADMNTSVERFDAAVLIDVIEHIPASEEQAVMRGLKANLVADGILIVGTPSAAFDHLMSPSSKAGHVNTYTHVRLHALMSDHFRLVIMAGMQDTAIHFGHPDARHYHIAVGVGPK